MGELKGKALYKRGENQELDKRFDEVKKMRLWSGTACCKALKKEEVDMMIKLWRKETFTHSELCADDVSELVNFAERIKEYRKCIRRNKSRLRQMRYREKLETAAKLKDPEAVRKVENIKTAGRLRHVKRRKIVKTSRKKDK